MRGLLALLQLETIDFYELSGRASAGFGDEPEPDLSGESQVAVNLNPLVRVREAGLDVRCRLEATTPNGVLIADGAAFYNSSTPFAVEEETALAFATDVGVMVLVPYLRQAIDDLSARLMFPDRVLLPIFPRGAITFVSEVTEANGDNNGRLSTEADE